MAGDSGLSILFIVDEFSAAHHEAAHAVVAVSLGLPLQDSGLHLDTVDGGIVFNLHRKPGDPANAPADIEERERSIVMIKAGYRANLKLFPGTPATVAADDRSEEIDLLNEMFTPHGQQWKETDDRLTAKAETLVYRNWDAIRALAKAVLAKPVAPRSPESFRRWGSPYPNERRIDGHEIAAILKGFGLNAIIRKESEGIYLSPDIHPEAKLP
jgi:hypothetical protein